MSSRTSRSALAGVLTGLTLAGVACSSDADEEPASSVLTGTITVPDDASSIQQAVDAAAPGATIEIGPGTYEESIHVETPDLTLRGTDRNEVVLDGGGLKSSGIVVTADRVQVENLTVRDFNLYGVLVTGMADDGGIASGSDGYTKLDPRRFPPVEGFAVRYVTASNNGLYGVYAFDSYDGVIEHNYASGHPDSGIYVGQCEPCDIVVRGNVAEYNAVGYEQTNASGDVYVVGNRFAYNRVGLTLMTDYQAAFVPQHDGVVAGNLIAHNAAARTPAQADGGYGIGIGIAGGRSNELRSNRIVGNPLAGIAITSSEDVEPVDNRFVANALSRNGIDLWYAASDRAPGAGNCLADNRLRTTEPSGLESVWACPDGGFEATGVELRPIRTPEGISFRDVGLGPDQPTMPADTVHTAAAPDVRVDDVAVPGLDLLADLARGGA